MSQGRRGSRESDHGLGRHGSDRGLRVSANELTLCVFMYVQNSFLAWDRVSPAYLSTPGASVDGHGHGWWDGGGGAARRTSLIRRDQERCNGTTDRSAILVAPFWTRISSGPAEGLRDHVLYFTLPFLARKMCSRSQCRQNNAIRSSQGDVVSDQFAEFEIDGHISCYLSSLSASLPSDLPSTEVTRPLSTMDLTSAQRQHASAVWSRLYSSIGGKGEDSVTSSKNAYIALGILNIPAPAMYYFIKSRTTRQAITEFPETWNAKIYHYFPDKKAGLLADHISSRVRDALHSFTSMLVLSPLTARQNRWWTLITANFTHFDLKHLVGNMLALNAVGPACAEVPGMTPLHVFGIALTASLATGFQALYRLSDTPGWTMCGFSAVVCAFTSVAALGAPMAEPDMFGKYPVKARSVWTVAGMQILSDVISMVRAKNGSGGARPGKSELVDYVGHLVGYACGAAYYAIFLWYQGSADDGGEESEVANQPVNVLELLRSSNQPAPVRESENWEEVASKLDYNAADHEA